METLRSTLAQVKVGPRTTFRGLTQFPLVGDGFSGPPGYLTLDQALADRVVTVSEIAGGGSVPTLQLLNEGDIPVLVMDGEELVGAKQNRTLNVTVLAPPRGRIVIPVSCVEAGRWHSVSHAFSLSKHAMYPEARARRAARVAESLAAGGVPRSDQGQVWNDIDRKMRRMGTFSKSREMRALYEDHAGSLDDYAAAFRPEEGQLGALFAIGGRLVGLDLFDHPETLSGILPKLVRSYALDAMEHAGAASAPPSSEEAEGFLRELGSTGGRRYESPGLGEDLRLRAPGLTASALLFEDRVLHLSAFRTEEHRGGNGGNGEGRGLRRPSRRLRFRDGGRNGRR
jgi:hypothetical protein